MSKTSGPGAQTARRAIRVGVLFLLTSLAMACATVLAGMIVHPSATLAGGGAVIALACAIVSTYFFNVQRWGRRKAAIIVICCLAVLVLTTAPFDSKELDSLLIWLLRF